MVNFKDACRWLRQGKKITRPVWEDHSYWKLGVDEIIEYSDGNRAVIHLNQLNATDWKIFKEKKIKCFWCELYVYDIVEHTNEMHPGLSPRSYDYLTKRGG